MQATSQSFTASRISPGSPRPYSGGGGGSAYVTGPPSSRLDQPMTLAHDAANILGALVLYCDLLQQPGVLDARHQHYGTELMELARRSAELVERLLGQLHVQAGPAAHLQAQSAPAVPPALRCAGDKPAYDPCDKLRELTPLLSSLAFPHATLALELPAGLTPWSNPPAEALERIVVNLVCNAAQALALRDAKDGRETPPRGRITVLLRRSGSRTVLEVTDNGPGIPAEMAAAFLLPSDPLAGPELGLGHRIVHEQAAATGARLAVNSRPGAGTTFSLSWAGGRREARVSRPLAPGGVATW